MFILQLSITAAHPVRSSGTAGTSNVNNRLVQRVTRNDPFQSYQQFEDNAEVVPPTDASFSEAVVLDQESSGTDSPLIQEDVNPFILVADDGTISSGVVPEPLEIVTPSFLEIPDVPVTDVEPTEKLEEPSIDTRIVAESFYNSPAHSPLEFQQWPPVAFSDTADDVLAAPTDLPIVIHSLSTFLPIPEETESFQKLEEPSFDPLVVFSPVLSEVESIQKIEDVSFDLTAVPVLNEPELIHHVETPSNEPLDINAPVLDVDAHNQSAVDPSINSFIFIAPVSDEAVAIQDNLSVDVSSVDVSISDGAQPDQNLKNPSGNLMEVVLVQDVPEFSVDTRIVTEPAINILADPFSQVAIEEPQGPAAQPSTADFLPQAVFISTVLPASTSTIAPFKLHEPASQSLYSVTSPKKIAAGNSVTHSPVTTDLTNLPIPAKTNLKSYPVGQQMKQQSPKQPPTYSKVKNQSNPTQTSSLKPQVQINQSNPTSAPAPAYGPPRATLATSNGKNNFSARPFGSSPKPRQLGFPPVSSTRDNVLLQVNWAANVGRPYRST